MYICQTIIIITIAKNYGSVTSDFVYLLVVMTTVVGSCAADSERK